MAFTAYLMAGMMALAGISLPAVIGQSPAMAQELTGLARFDAGKSAISGSRGTYTLSLAISQPVPWRVRVLDNPARLVIDAREVDWSQLAEFNHDSVAVSEFRAGSMRQGWSRLVVDLSDTYLPVKAEMVTQGAGARMRITLKTVAAEAFATAAAEAEPAEWAIPEPAALPAKAVKLPGPRMIVLDPGHGGIDPGAENGGVKEADLMLTFARELKELLLRDGEFDVLLTRDADDFVPLESRIKIARAAGADVFVSLHADAVNEGEASGATVYTLAEEASDDAAQALAERHDRSEILAGVDLSAQDDLVASILMDMARTETAPRIERLAKALSEGIKGAGLKMHANGRQTAGFSVLKSPDIPSVLLEMGYISSDRDLERLTDPLWRAQMALAVRNALAKWAQEDAAITASRLP